MRHALTLSALALAAATLTAAAPQPEVALSPALTKALAGLTPGPAMSCISLPAMRNSTIFSDPDTIVYRENRNRLFVNQPAGGCSLSGDPILVTSTPSSQLCSGDIVRLIDRASRMPRGGCGLGKFVPYTR